MADLTEQDWEVIQKNHKAIYRNGIMAMKEAEQAVEDIEEVSGDDFESDDDLEEGNHGEDWDAGGELESVAEGEEE